jgi:hypothetical protein
MRTIVIDAEYVFNPQSLGNDLPKPVSPTPENAVQVDFTGTEYICYVEDDE